MRPKYNRILLKLSGESLMGNQGYGIDQGRLRSYAQQIYEIASEGTQVAIVIGGGNIFRGVSGVSKGYDRVMDITATAMCKENNMPIVVFDMDTPGNLARVINGEEIGTLVY